MLQLVGKRARAGLGIRRFRHRQRAEGVRRTGTEVAVYRPAQRNDDRDRGGDLGGDRGMTRREDFPPLLQGSLPVPRLPSG